MITILIIDDHPLVGDGISTMLNGESYLKILGICKTAKEAMAFLKTNQPEIILLDINLPDMNGLMLCERIRENNNSSKIIGLTSTNEAGIIIQFLSKGANGYLLKNMERDELLLAIREVMNDKIFLSKAANQKLLEQYNTVNQALKSVPILTRREKEILGLLYEGFNGPQIAEKLFISHFMVETHRKNLMQKMNANTTQLLLKKAKAFNLV